MRITRVYRNTGIDASNLQKIGSLVHNWGHKVWDYVLNYGPDQVVKCATLGGVENAVNSRGETRSHLTHLESQKERILRIDTTDPTRITVEVDDKDQTLGFLARLENVLGLVPRPRRVFVTHGQSKLWLEVQRFVEKDAHLNLEVVELADEPSKGKTISMKLNDVSGQCSYAVVVMTGEDLTVDDEVRVRENVMHEIGFFQGRYGPDRICLMREDGVNIASNLSGIVYCGFPRGNIRAALADLLRELRAAFLQ